MGGHIDISFGYLGEYRGMLDAGKVKPVAITGFARSALLPDVPTAQEAGLPVDGPFPADTLFWRHRQGEFAAIVCMYHDQGLIPLKILHFMNSVNVTLGLPIIRTSVDHGTAYNLAGTGQAASASLKAAIRMAAEMAKRRF